MLTHSIFQVHRQEHLFCNVHGKRALKIQEVREGNPLSYSKEQGGTASHDEMNLQQRHRKNVQQCPYTERGQGRKCWVTSH